MSPIFERLIPTKAELDVSHDCVPRSRGAAGWLPRKDVHRRANATLPISVNSPTGSGICAEYSSYLCLRQL
jgi:hypothetical protein